MKDEAPGSSRGLRATRSTVRRPLRALLLMSAGLLLAACSEGISTARSEVFSHAFGDLEPETDVQVISAAWWHKREWLVLYTEAWRLQLRGPRAMALARSRWPDLRSDAPPKVRMVAADARFSWYMPKGLSNYTYWTRESDARLRVAEDKQTHDLFIEFERGW